MGGVRTYNSISTPSNVHISLLVLEHVRLYINVYYLVDSFGMMMMMMMILLEVGMYQVKLSQQVDVFFLLW